MSKRMTSETIIFDTDWLTEDDFNSEEYIVVSINYQAYDTLKIIVHSEDVVFDKGGLFQEFDVYKLEKFGFDYKDLLIEEDSFFEIYQLKEEGNFELIFYLDKSYWQNYLEGMNSIYIKGVKR